MATRNPTRSTGDDALDAAVQTVLDLLGPGTNRDLMKEILSTSVLLAREDHDRLDLKITNAALGRDARGVRGVPALPRPPQGHHVRLGPHPARRPALRSRPASWPSALAERGLDGGHRRRSRDHGRRHGGRRPRALHRRQHPPAVRAVGQRVHRRRPEARRDEVLLHPQAHADQGVRRVRRRCPAGSARSTRPSSCSPSCRRARPSPRPSCCSTSPAAPTGTGGSTSCSERGAGRTG